jgi:hypothetical protein
MAVLISLSIQSSVKTVFWLAGTDGYIGTHEKVKLDWFAVTFTVGDVVHPVVVEG